MTRVAFTLMLLILLLKWSMLTVSTMPKAVADLD